MRIVGENQPLVDSQPDPVAGAPALTSDHVMKQLRPDMETLGYAVERGKHADEKIFRPVLFGDDGKASVTYEINAFHDELGIAVEVEAGRGVQGNADYRDIVRTSLLLDANYFVLMLPLAYRYKSKGKNGVERLIKQPGYANTRDLLSAIYASQRLRLPFEGTLLIGYWCAAASSRVCQALMRRSPRRRPDAANRTSDRRQPKGAGHVEGVRTSMLVRRQAHRTVDGLSGDC